MSNNFNPILYLYKPLSVLPLISCLSLVMGQYTLCTVFCSCMLHMDKMLRAVLDHVQRNLLSSLKISSSHHLLGKTNPNLMIEFLENGFCLGDLVLNQSASSSVTSFQLVSREPQPSHPHPLDGWSCGVHLSCARSLFTAPPTTATITTWAALPKRNREPREPSTRSLAAANDRSAKRS